MELIDKLKLPACSNWISVNDAKPEIFEYVLINTQYCRYPAQIASWNGFEFRGTDNGKFENVTHWTKINDLGQKIPRLEMSDYDLLQQSIKCLENSFDIIRMSKIKKLNIDLIYESIGFQISNLHDELGKLKPQQ